jgi:hypothetical protein
MQQRIEAVWNTATGRGVGFEPQPVGGLFDGRAVNGYFVDLSAKTQAPGAVRPERLSPAGLAQLALGWWERSLKGDAGAGGAFDRVCALIEARAVADGAELRWPYDMRVPKYKLNPPWHSALAQGQIGSVLVRAHIRTSDDRYADMARRAVLPLIADASGGLVTITSYGPILEEAPSAAPSHILNGWIYALWGLWDVAVSLGDGAAAERFERSTRCLSDMIDDYDVGWWTLYSLYPHRLPDLAKPFYQGIHVAQAEVMSRLTGLPVFDDAWRRWRRYNGFRGRMRALGQKALFVAAVRAFDS